MSTALITAAAQDSDFNWTGFLILLVVAAAGLWLIRKLRPGLRERRHQAWKEAGLLPEQVERRDDDGRDKPDLI